MGKDKKRKLSESASVGEMQRIGDFVIQPEDVRRRLDTPDLTHTHLLTHIYRSPRNWIAVNGLYCFQTTIN